MAKKPKIKKGAWFVAIRGSYLPVSWEGWLTYFPFAAYLLFSLYFGFDQTDSTAKAILFVVPNWVAAAVAMTWLAKRTS